MGKKSKTGKARKDKFYHLAKETGYRARSAFKLLQLNRKFEFLQKSRVCVDLCAAPGSWLQVAANHMPISSHIIGVDLVPIKPIAGVTTLQGDITTDACRQAIKKELKTWKADVVIHDGAPNVGKSWVHDAFAQAELTLYALKLATDFLRQGGWFVTKVFRSKDYHALLWVFGQMFRKVHATKPQASRNESAEIFVACQGYKAPDKIDPKFLDPKYVFQDVGGEPKAQMNLIHPEKVKKKAEGYAEGDYTLHHIINASDFIMADNHLDMLAECSQILIDSKAIENHSAMTGEIKECFKDIKVLGKREIRNILTWRKTMKQALEKVLKASEESTGTEGKPLPDEGTKSKRKRREAEEEEEEMEVEELAEIEEVDLTARDQEEEESWSSEVEGQREDEEDKVQEQLSQLQDQERKALKKKRKQVLKEKRKLRDKLSLNMVIPGDNIDITEDISIFDLKTIKTKQQIADVEKEDLSDHEGLDVEEDEEPQGKKRAVMYDRHEDSNESESEEDSEPEDLESGPDEGESDDEADQEEAMDSDRNPLVVDLDTEKETKSQKTDMWFRKDVFSGLEAEEDEDIEVSTTIDQYKQKGGVILGKETKNEKKKKRDKKKGDSTEECDIDDFEDSAIDCHGNSDDRPMESSDDSSSSSDSDSDYDMYQKHGKKQKKKSAERTDAINKAAKDGFEIVPSRSEGKRVRLDPIGLALGEELIKSSKRRRELIEETYNRYTFEDNGLPDWFVQDESKHMKKPLPVSKEKIEAYKEKMKAINARPIKKVAEAEARKKKKLVRRTERARKRAETISDTVDSTDREKWKAIRDVYKRAGLLSEKKKEVTYVVAKKGTGRRVSRPAGVKGKFKVVDPRMKKDKNKNSKDKKGRRKK